MFTFFDIFGHLANALYTVGSNFKDILWLRVFLVLGGLSELFYSFYIAGHPLWTNIMWGVIIVSINSVMIFLLLRERGALTLEEKEVRLYRMVFPNLSKIHFKKLISVAVWANYEEGTVMINENEPVNELLLIFNGSVAINVDKRVVSHVRDGGFIGEISFLTGNPPSATVVAVTPITAVSWEKNLLRTLLDKNPELETALYSVFSTDLTKKIVISNKEKPGKN